jgi:hypothetical protein
MPAQPLDDPYPILGVREPVLYGRSKDVARLLRHLGKRTPDHIAIVGPRYIGKTTVVKHITKTLPQLGLSFDGCIYWNTRAVVDDVSFRREFGRAAFAALKSISDTAAKALTGYSGESFDLIHLAFAALDDEKKRVLVVLDGFDEALLRSEINPNHWENMRLIGEMNSVRYVTCTRRRLVDLCARPESVNSPFFNLFSGPMLLGPFLEEDIEDLVKPFGKRNITFDKGAQKEILNWSGGIPIIASHICRLLWEGTDDGRIITRERVNECGQLLSEMGKEVLQMLWKDCDEDERADFLDLMAGRITKPPEIPRDRRESLSQRGYLRSSEDKVEPGCRIIEQYARDHGADSSGLRRIFADRQAFDANIQGLLQLRFATLKMADTKICNYIRLAIQELDKPDVVLNQVRAASERALDLWLDKELPDRKIPVDWSDGWNKKDRDGNPAENHPPTGTVPFKRGGQCYLLRLLADPRKSGKTRIRQSTELLIDALQSVGDFGHHREGELPGIMYGASVCFDAMQMAEQLAEDLAKPAP